MQEEMKVIQLQTRKSRLHTTTVIVAAKYQGHISKIALSVDYDLSQDDEGRDVVDIDGVQFEGLEMLDRMDDKSTDEVRDLVLEQIKNYRESEAIDAAILQQEQKKYG